MVISYRRQNVQTIQAGLIDAPHHGAVAGDLQAGIYEPCQGRSVLSDPCDCRARHNKSTTVFRTARSSQTARDCSY